MEYIKDANGKYIGYYQESEDWIYYYGYSVGFVGKYDKKYKRYYYMRGPKTGSIGPMSDIGISEVMSQEHAKF